jgi:carboxyl-terminal processing protease
MMRRFRYRVIAGLAVLLLGTLAFKTTDKYFEIAKSLDIMAAVYRDLNLFYVDSVDAGRLMQTGIEAMTQSLDPYTYYFSENDLGDLNFQTTGKYGGVGTAIRKAGDTVVITDVYADAPFDKAGIRPGDILVSLNGIPTTQMSLDAISNLLKGDPGSSLEVVIRHPMKNRTSRYHIKRKEIDIHGVTYTGMADSTTGYIKLIQFTEGVSAEVARAIVELKKAHPDLKGLILDLRGNPGGLLNEAVKTANLFIPTGDTILSTHGRVSDWNRVYQATARPVDSQIPLAVLTDSHSASASEIVAGAIQDLDRGIIVGQRSFGKGLVQTTRSLPYHTKVKITTAKYYTPSGRCIQAIDYAHRSDDGSITYIPDSLKKDFYTKKGRRVKDGGGIEPDQLVPREYLSNISSSLVSHHLIFDFATRYFYSHPAPPELGSFHLSAEDFEAFIRFINTQHFSYQTRAEMALERFRGVALQEGYFDDIDSSYHQLQKQLKHNKEQDLRKHRAEISRLLESEIMSRYYNQNGRIAQALPTDNVVRVASRLLENPQGYRELLDQDPE